MESFVFGKTASNLPILAHKFGRTGPEILFIAGVHGNENEGIRTAYALINHFDQNFGYRLRLTIIPQFNLDGIFMNQRENSRGVDLNRNLPTSDWTEHALKKNYNPGPYPNSEPENQALIKFIEEHSIKFIISLHSWHPVLNINGDCRVEAEIIQKFTDYEIKDSIGYPTPGCLGSYCGLERDIPTITYELEREIHTEKIIAIHVPAICEALKINEKNG